MELVANPSQFFFGTHLGENIKTIMNDVGEGASKVVKRTAKQYSSAFNVGQGYLNSFIIAASTTILTVFFSSLTAYGLVVYDFKLSGPAYTFIIAVMMIPVQVSSAGFVAFMYSLGLVNSFIPLIVPAIAAPAVIFFMVSYMKSSFPLDIVEASRIDGCGEFRTFLTIAIPMMKPAMAVQAIFVFVANWNNYYTQNMILKNEKLATVPIMVSKVLAFDKNLDNGANFLCVTLSILPIVIVYFILSKFIIAGVALGGVKE
jgi:multiple sugar transport system permease protein